MWPLKLIFACVGTPGPLTVSGLSQCYSPMARKGARRPLGQPKKAIGIESPIEPSGCHNNQRLACTASDSERRRAHVDEPPGNARGTQNAYRTQSGLDVEGTFCLPVVGRKMSLDIPFHRTSNAGIENDGVCLGDRYSVAEARAIRGVPPDRVEGLLLLCPSRAVFYRSLREQTPVQEDMDRRSAIMGLDQANEDCGKRERQCGFSS